MFWLGIMITITVFMITVKINQKVKSIFTSPIILSIFGVALVISLLDIPYESYYEGSKHISWFLGPTVISLAVLVKRNSTILKKYHFVIVGACLTATLTAILSNFFLFKFAGFSKEVIYSFIPKHVTTPIAIDITKLLGGNPAMTIGITFFTGIIGFLTVGYFMDKFSMKDPITRGLVIGTAFHGLGVTKAVEEGELTGAVGSIAFVLTGIMTSFLAPLLIWLF